MRKLLLIATILYNVVLVSQTTITGVVNDITLGGPLPGANVKLIEKAVGTTTNFNGEFTLKVTEKPPFTIKISSLGYTSKTFQITKKNQNVVINLEENATSLDEIVISASRTPERIMESPVTIERFDSRAIKNTASASFYDGLENLKGVDINASSLTFKSVNTRGFATFGNNRFMQLVDGMDNSSPALNFALGNLLGLSELDVKSVELLPGASSALYGANAFNGIMFMTSKSPFDDQGISTSIKGGITSQEAAGNNSYYDAGIRMAYKFSNYFAAKATFSFLKGTEWYATDYRNTSDQSYAAGNRESDPNFDGVNIYGDEVSVDLGGNIGNVSRTGYNEIDLVDYDAQSLKFGAALHFRPLGNDKLEIIWNTKLGRGNTIYQGANRYSIKDFYMHQHKLEIKGENFFIRGYLTGEDAGNSYDSRFTAININKIWKSDEDWFSQYAAAYLGAIPNVEASNHNIARAFADIGRLEPGSANYRNALNSVTSDPDLTTGSKFQDKSKLYHVDANMNLNNYIDFAEVQVGGSFRSYSLNSNGTIYTDANERINYNEYGLYTQIQKKLIDDRLKLTGSVRYDKAQNFNGNASPRLSVAYAAGENKTHNFRASIQTGFRYPSTQDQYIGLNAAVSHLIGSAPDNIDRYNTPEIILSDTGANLTGESTISISSRNAFENSFSVSSVQAGLPEKADVNLVKPERVTAFEIGYRSALNLGENKISIDLSTYYNDYTDFISLENVVAPLYGNVNLSDVTGTTPNAFIALANEDIAVFTTYTNTSADISSYGTTIGLNTKIFNGFNVGLNYTWSKFNFDQDSDPDFEAAFNTPEHKIKFQFGKPNLFKNFGFNINLRWQDQYLWESTFLDATIDSRTVVDAQINYKVPSIKSVFKLGGTNLSGQEYLSAPGVGSIGSQYYLSWVINN